MYSALTISMTTNKIPKYQYICTNKSVGANADSNANVNINIIIKMNANAQIRR